ncbi:MAG: hypothetical protein GX667_08470 [Xanthomonadaceae bacterium]|nr:hypothetical protein [Xanthomonadaceae bacterium]
MEKEYALLRLNDEQLKLTEAAWKNDSEELFYAMNYDAVFDAIKFHLVKESNGSSHESLYFGLAESKNSPAKAIVELVTTPKIGLAKLLNITLPIAYLDSEQGEDFREIAAIYLRIILGCVKFSADNDVTMKLYGRSSEFLSILRVTYNTLKEKHEKEFKKIELDGRWLTLQL